MPNSVDFCKGVFLNVIPVRIIVLTKDKQELGLKTPYSLKTSIHWGKVIDVSLLYTLVRFDPVIKQRKKTNL